MTTIRRRQWRTPKGSRRCAFVVDYQDKRGRRRTKQFATKAAASKWIESPDFSASQYLGDEKRTFDDAVDAWLCRGRSESLEQATLDHYQWLLGSYILPIIGKVPLHKVSREMLVQLRLGIINTKSQSLAARVMRVAKMVLSYAVKIEMLAKNPAAGMRTSVAARYKKRPDIPSRDEIRAILSAPPRHGNSKAPGYAYRRNMRAYATMVESALRPCELRALAWPQVDLERGRITVLRDAKLNGRIGACKTKASYRTIPISPYLVTALTEWKTECPPSPEYLVFPRQDGGLVMEGPLSKSFRAIQVALGISKITSDSRGKQRIIAKFRLYDLRHAAASWWIYKGVDLKKLTTWMGHSSIQTTFDIYGHLIDDAGYDHTLMADLAKDLYCEPRADGRGPSTEASVPDAADGAT